MSETPGIDWQGQAGQDRIAHWLFPEGERFYLELGGGDPKDLSNSYALEALGWNGISIERDPEIAKRWPGKRRNPCIEADAITIDWDALDLPPVIHFVSADIDESTLPALLRFPFHRTKVHFLTYEHNRYLYGDAFVTPGLSLFLPLGFVLACSDVRLLHRQLGEYPFEDWFVSPETVERAGPIMGSADIDWLEICDRAGLSGHRAEAPV